MADALLEVQDLVKYFPVYHRGVLMKKKVGDVHAIDTVSIRIGKGETLGLV